MQRIRNKIRLYRKASGETQKQLAELMNVTVTTIGFWESGKRSPRDDMKIRIAMHYGVPVEKIFFAPDMTKSVELRG